jgi:hypothetical protein
MEFRSSEEGSQRRRREKLIFVSEIAGVKNGLEEEAGRMVMKPTSPARTSTGRMSVHWGGADGNAAVR